MKLKNITLVNLTLAAVLSSVSLVGSAAQYVNLDMVGTPSKIERVDGFGVDMPLINVLDKIIPTGWVVKKLDKNDPINLSKPVNWKSGYWVSILDQISYQGQFKASIDWNKKEVTLFSDSGSYKQRPVESVTHKDRVKPSNQDMFVAPTLRKVEYEIPENARLVSDTTVIFDANGRIIAREKEYERKGGRAHKYERKMVSDEFMGVDKQPNRQPKEESAVFEVDHKHDVLNERVDVVTFEHTESVYVEKKPSGAMWTLDSGKSLKDNVTNWGEKAGYDVVWNGSDYPVDRERSLFGDFDSVDGPIKQLSEDYGPNSHVKNPLSFKFYKNKTLVVDDVRYEQGGSYSNEY